MATQSSRRALITGASSGIGAAFARALAARHQDLVLVARSAGKLEALAEELTAKHDVRADVITADLADPHAADAIVAELAARDISIGMLINNAGFGTLGEFVGLDPARERDEVFVNAFAPHALTRALLPAMVARRSGAIINVASTASFQPVPYMATYGATKAFLLSFSEAVAEEVRPYGVRVLALAPGYTTTAFHDHGLDQARMGHARSAEQVVEVAFRALERGKSVVVDGFSNLAMVNASRFAPRWLVARVAANMLRPRQNSRTSQAV
jgi:uncharacterized protein